MADVRVTPVVADHFDGTTFPVSPPVRDVRYAFVQMLSGGTRPAGSGPIGTTGNTNTDRAAALELTDTGTITGWVTANEQVRSCGQLWEYVGPLGGRYEFVVLWSGAVTITDSLIVQPLTGVADKDRLVPFLGGVTYNNNALDWNDVCVTAWINGDGDLIVSRGPGKSGTTTVYVSVVDFRGPGWEVFHARSTNHDTADEAVDVRTDSDGEGGSVVTIDDWDKCLLVGYMEGDAGGEEGLSDTLAIWRPDTTTTVLLDVHQDGNARNDGPAHCHIIRCQAWDVKRYSSGNWTEGNGTWTPVTWPAGMPTDRDPDEYALEWFCDTSGVGTAHMRGAIGPRIVAPGTVEGWVHRERNNVAVQLGVVDLSSVEDVGPMSQVGTLTGTARIDLATGLIVEVRDDVPSSNWAVNNLGGWWEDTLTGVELGWGYEAGHSIRFAPVWEQPTGAPGYGLNDWVFHLGRLWRSLVDGNVWEPGVANWRPGDVNGLNVWIQPTGAFDAYPKDLTVLHPDEAGTRYMSEIDANTTTPGAQGSELFWTDLDALEALDDTDWRSGVAYVVDDIVTYAPEPGARYVCIQGHTSQPGWEPPNVPALWALVT